MSAQITTLDPTLARIGAGVLYIAAIGTAEPATPSAAFPSGWHQVGPTSAGHTDDLTIASADVDVAESLDPLTVVTTGRTMTVAFSATYLTATNLIAAYNGGTMAIDGNYYKVEPPAIGTEVPLMLAWSSFDARERKIWRRCLNTGSVQLARQKAPGVSLVPFSLRVLPPGGGLAPFSHWIDQTLQYAG